MSSNSIVNPFKGKPRTAQVELELGPDERPEYREPIEGYDRAGNLLDADRNGRIDITEPVPMGTTKEILAWVGSDLSRAKRALDVEESKGKNGLKGLKRELTKMLEE